MDFKSTPLSFKALPTQSSAFPTPGRVILSPDKANSSSLQVMWTFAIPVSLPSILACESSTISSVAVTLLPKIDVSPV